jgi:hypothetical protein
MSDLKMTMKPMPCSKDPRDIPGVFKYYIA